MKELYTAPEMNVVEIEVEDIVTASDGDMTDIL